MIGDVIGAVVEAESPSYIRKTFQNLDEILALKTVLELITGEWEVGRFTDDTQMSLSVAQWLAEETKPDGKSLLERFCRAYEPWRRYGPGARLILESFPNAKERWKELATVMFPQGSYGNGSAMRVAPIGLFFHNDLEGVISAARVSSAVTHSHYLAIQGAALQAAAVAGATRGLSDGAQILRILKATLSHFENRGEDTGVYTKAVAVMAEGLSRKVPPGKIVQILGNGIKAQEAVPMAIYCYLANPGSFEKAVEAAVFLGGDTDTIASMAGSLAGAVLGESHIPARWLRRVTEPDYTVERIRQIAFALYRKGESSEFKSR
jgi:poly(ADP-ribose) glycohydrolase ARH3